MPQRLQDDRIAGAHFLVPLASSEAYETSGTGGAKLPREGDWAWHCANVGREGACRGQQRLRQAEP